MATVQVPNTVVVQGTTAIKDFWWSMCGTGKDIANRRYVCHMKMHDRNEIPHIN